LVSQRENAFPAHLATPVRYAVRVRPLIARHDFTRRSLAFLARDRTRPGRAVGKVLLFALLAALNPLLLLAIVPVMLVSAHPKAR
jgi:hypothetical protein